jgi:hypothetical protein
MPNHGVLIAQSQVKKTNKRPGRQIFRNLMSHSGQTIGIFSARWCFNKVFQESKETL